MMTCSGCNSQQYTGTIFCATCGASFVGPAPPRSTTRLVELATAPPAPVAAAAPAHQLEATLVNTGRRIILPMDAPILIGRQDSRRDFFPSLDLTNDGGYEGGVSRRHAQICGAADEAVVEDLHSGNGTFVNDQQVTPGNPHHLHIGDELRLGSIIIRIEAL